MNNLLIAWQNLSALKNFNMSQTFYNFGRNSNGLLTPLPCLLKVMGELYFYFEEFLILSIFREFTIEFLANFQLNFVTLLDFSLCYEIILLPISLSEEVLACFSNNLFFWVATRIYFVLETIFSF